MNIEYKIFQGPYNLCLQTYMAIEFLEISDYLSLREVSHSNKNFIDRVDFWNIIANQLGVPFTANQKKPYEVVKKICKFYSHRSLKQDQHFDNKSWIPLSYLNDIEIKKRCVKYSGSGINQMESINNYEHRISLFFGLDRYRIKSLSKEVNNIFTNNIIREIYMTDPSRTLNSYTTIPVPGQFYNIINNNPIFIKGLQELKIANFTKECCQLTNLLKLTISPIVCSESLISGILPNEIGELKKLTSLSINNCNISFLPDEFKRLTLLKELFLQKNSINIKNTFVIPHLVNLKILDMRSNRLSTLPDDYSNLYNLECLNISNNKFSLLPPVLNKLRKLTTLSLANNYFNATLTLNNINNLTNLKILNLSSNKIDKVNELTSLKGLTQLNLFSNNIRKMPPEISRLTNLHTLMTDSFIHQKRLFFFKNLKIHLFNEKFETEDKTGFLNFEDTPFKLNLSDTKALHTKFYSCMQNDLDASAQRREFINDRIALKERKAKKRKEIVCSSETSNKRIKK